MHHPARCCARSGGHRARGPVLRSRREFSDGHAGGVPRAAEARHRAAPARALRRSDRRAPGGAHRGAPRAARVGARLRRAHLAGELRPVARGNRKQGADRAVTIAPLLAELRNRDIQVWADGERLQCNAPAGALTPELREQLLQRRSEILEFLRGPAELSFSQERLWFLDQIEPGGAAYVVALALEMRGALDVPALERALGALVSRHESLRTVFANVEGKPLQGVLETAPGALPDPQWIGEGEPPHSRASDRTVG